MHIQASRLSRFFEEMSEIGKVGETGTCRPAHSPEEKQAFGLARSWMEAAGLKVKTDDFGNLIGVLEGTDPSLPIVMAGSHLDSQPLGGRFDGVAGVLGAIEAVATVRDKGIKLRRSVHVVSFADEEGWRFKKGLFGSRGILGRLEEGELERCDQQGISRRQALTDFGCDPGRLSESRYPEGSLHAYLELHIEQGPVLDRMNKPVGIVTGIAGPLWLSLSLKGMAGHTGSVPMHMRQDALMGAAEVIVALNAIATQVPGAPTVGSVGTIEVFPGSRNIIPGEARLTLDLRDIDMERRNRYEHMLREQIEGIAARRGLTYTLTEDTNSEPRYCAPRIMEVIRKSCDEMGLGAPELMSGPFHDALALSYACDYGMIFVRCRDGISHNPLEYASPEDLALGTEVLYRTLVSLAG